MMGLQLVFEAAPETLIICAATLGLALISGLIIYLIKPDKRKK